MRMQLLDRVKKNEKAYYNLLHYVRGYEKCRKGYFGTSNVCVFPNATVEESVHYTAQKVREITYCNVKLAMHLIIQFAPSELVYLDHSKVLEIGYFISLYDMPECITFFAVHDHSEHLHLDMMIFPYSIYDGKAYHISKKSLYKIGMDIQKYLLKYVPQKNISQIQPVYGRT